jgi:hypothetical protein
MRWFIYERPRVDPVRGRRFSGGGSGSGITAGRCFSGDGGYGAPFTTRFLPTALEQRRELISLTLDSGDGLYRVGGDGILHSDLADGGEILQTAFSFKIWMGSLPASTPRS